MSSILFKNDEFGCQIEQLNREREKLQDIYNELLRYVITESDKIGDFKIKANMIKEELLRVEEKIISLKERAVRIREVYSDVEELNLRLVNDLPSSIEEYMAKKGNSSVIGPNLNSPYHVTNHTGKYMMNAKYDFEDWLVEWLNANPHI